MTTTRRPDESFPDFKVRQKLEAAETKRKKYTGTLLVDSSKGQGITGAGVARAKARIAAYKEGKIVETLKVMGEKIKITKQKAPVK